VLITDELFEAYLKCNTKAHLTFGPARGEEHSHPISDWQQRLAENYQTNCRDRLQFADSADCFVGSPCSEDLKSAKYRLIIQPYIIAQDGRPENQLTTSATAAQLPSLTVIACGRGSGSGSLPGPWSDCSVGSDVLSGRPTDVIQTRSIHCDGLS
jgi:hypothetical protein